MSGDYRVLGGLTVLDGRGAVELGGPKQRAVLGALLVEPGRPVSPSRLIDWVWGDEPPARAETSLQAYVSNLRRALEPDRKPRDSPRLLVTQPAGYALLVDRADVDATAFADLATQGHDLLVAGDPVGATAILDQGLQLWAGPPMPEFADLQWVVELTTHLGEVRARAIEDRIEAGLSLGEHELLVPRIMAAIAEEPFRERLRAQHALALYRSGRQRDALVALADARTALVEDAGLEPGPELRQLEADILAQSPSLDAPRSTPRVVPVSPTESAGATSSESRTVDATPRDQTRPFVGRDEALGALLEAYEHAANGAGRPVVVRGEPGIGKTRLVEELVSRVPEAFVAWGRCPESAGSAAFWPVIQIGRQLEGADALEGDLVGRLLAEGDGRSQGPAADRLTLHASIAHTLGTARRPLVLVVDDLHWADPASLRVIEFVAAELQHTRILLIVTTRPVAADASVAYLDCLGELARQPGVVNLELEGLSEPAVAEWLRARSQRSPDPAVADLVYDRTAGNPFFVGEVVEMLAGEDGLDPLGSTGDRARVPAAVQDVIRRRVGRLPSSTQQLLSAASVIGRGFDVDLLGDVTDTEPLDVLDQLEAGLDAGIVVETDIPGRFGFSHALVNETLIAELGAARRVRLHAATAAAIERRRAGDLDSHAAELAFHAFEGAAAGTADRAVEWSVRSATLAASRLAFEDAAIGWSLAVRSLELARPGDREARFEALEGLARAHLAADDIPNGYEAIVEAIDVAIELDDPERVGRVAALANIEGLWFAGELGLIQVDIMGALERALAVVPDDMARERALVMGALAENAYWVWTPEQLDDTTADALELARATGDAAVVGRTLHKRVQALWRADAFEARAATSAALVELVEREEVPPEIEAIARFVAGAVAFERADAVSAREQYDQAITIAHRINSPALITQLDFALGAVRTWFGEFAQAEADIERAYQLYRRTRRWAAEEFRAGYDLFVQVEQMRLDDVLAGSEVILASSYRPWFGEAVAYALVELGEPERAAEVVAGVLPPLIDCWMYTGTVAIATHTRVALGDREACEILAPHLRPHVGRLACIGTGPPCGDIALALSKAEALLGNEGEARRLADISVDVVSRSGPGPWLARALVWRHGLNGDPADLDRATEIVRDLDLRSLARQL